LGEIKTSGDLEPTKNQARQISLHAMAVQFSHMKNGRIVESLKFSLLVVITLNNK
jgi:hypothetical protein